MTRVGLFDEESEGVYRFIVRTVGAKGRIKVSKERLIRLMKGDEKKVKMFSQRTIWGRFPGLDWILNLMGFGWETIPCYRTSYKSGEVLDWEKDSQVEIPADLLQALSEEDSMVELAKASKRAEDRFIDMMIGGVVGALFCYFAMSGGLDQFMAALG